MSNARRARSDWGLRIGLGVVAVGAAAFAMLLLRAQELPTGVVPVAWDKEPCAHCRMHVGERGFAAQLQLADQRVLNFDDPGCLMSFLSRHRSDPAVVVHATYLHHSTEERWLAREAAGFARVPTSPMGFGLAAVDGSTPGALTWDQAEAVVKGAGGAPAGPLP